MDARTEDRLLEADRARARQFLHTSAQPLPVASAVPATPTPPTEDIDAYALQKFAFNETVSNTFVHVLIEYIVPEIVPTDLKTNRNAHTFLAVSALTSFRSVVDYSCPKVPHVQPEELFVTFGALLICILELSVNSFVWERSNGCRSVELCADVMETLLVEIGKVSANEAVESTIAIARKASRVWGAMNLEQKDIMLVGIFATIQNNGLLNIQLNGAVRGACALFRN